MKTIVFRPSVLLSLIGAVAVFAIGCSQQATESDGESLPVAEVSHEGHDHDASHGGWWCVEHGIPEEKCSMCSSKAAEECKAKGDWCEEHNRAESQCFICDASRADKFAKLYEAKVGHKPPKVEESQEEQEGN